MQIVGIWTGAEQTAFEQILDHSGIHYVYTGSRNLDQLLQSDVRNQTPPDLAVVASPTDLAGYYANGQLEKITGVARTTTPEPGRSWCALAVVTSTRSCSRPI